MIGRNVFIDELSSNALTTECGFVILDKPSNIDDLAKFASNSGKALYVNMSLVSDIDEVFDLSTSNSIFGLVRCLNQLVTIDTIKKLPEIISDENFWVVAPNQ